MTAPPVSPSQGGLCRCADSEFSSSDTTSVDADDMQQTQDEIMNLMTIMYMAIQTTINDPQGMRMTREALCK